MFRRIITNVVEMLKDLKDVIFPSKPLLDSPYKKPTITVSTSKTKRVKKKKQNYKKKK